MSKKKSYMDMDNILSEGFYKKIIHKIADKLTARALKNDPKIKKDIDNLNQELKDLWDDFNKSASDVDSDYKPFKPKKVTIDDFIG